MTVPQIITPARKLKTPDQQHQALVKQTQKWVAQTFYGTIFKQMRESPFKDKIMSGGRGGEAFGGMLDQQMADRMAKSSGAKLVNAIVDKIEYAQHQRTGKPMPKRKPTGINPATKLNVRA
jgi:Rod binding domain-containing protein